MESTNLNLLQAMLLLAETLDYSITYKKELIKDIKFMIESEELLINNCYLESI